MLHTLLGAERFRRGMDLYFERHDGKAVTCDDFVQAMADASAESGGPDLAQFRRWYAQAGTPVVTVRGRHDPALAHVHARGRAAARRRRPGSRSRRRSTSRWPWASSDPTAATCR